MLRHAILNKDGKVVNIILWDGQTKWNPPASWIVVKCEGINVHVGDSYDFQQKKFIPRSDRLSKPD